MYRTEDHAYHRITPIDPMSQALGGLEARVKRLEREIATAKHLALRAVFLMVLIAVGLCLNFSAAQMGAMLAEAFKRLFKL